VYQRIRLNVDTYATLLIFGQCFRRCFLKKHFRLTVDLAVEIGETVDKGVKRRALLEDLLKAFLKDEDAMFRFFRLWLKDDFRNGDLGEKIGRCFVRETDTEILKPVVEACPKKAREHFLAALKEEIRHGNCDRYSDLEQFFGQLQFFEVERAEFEMAGEGRENG